MSALQRIVWVCQWYPHDGEPYTGDFIQRHAQAVAQFVPITILACFEHPTKQGIEKTTKGNLTEIIHFYKPIKTGIDKIDKALRWSRWFSILKKQLLHYEQVNGRPQLLHCHILLNTGWLGLWAKKKWGIPFLATEHWSGFMLQAVNGFDKYNAWSKKKLTKIIREASIVTCVSKALIEQLQLIEPQGNYVRTPNVVNDKIFHFTGIEKKTDNPVFIHISTGSPQKNIQHILDGFAFFCQRYPMATLIMVCPKKGDKYQPPETIAQNIVWQHDMPQAELAKLMRGTNGCILYSNYETFGCVIIEANALGIPVIVSNIPVLQELVTTNENGMLASLKNSTDLANALEKTMQFSFNHSAISANTLSQFSYEKVGQQFIDIYHNILG